MGEILEPGRHILSAADHYFDSWLSTQQVGLRLNDEAQVAPAVPGTSVGGEDLIIAETKDFVKVGICADIFYSIADAAKTVKRVGKDGVRKLVLETAIGTLTNIIRSTALSEIAQSQNVTDAPTYQKGEEGQSGKASAPFFFDRAHDDFIERYGIEISNIRVASCKIMDANLAESIAKQALVTAQTENHLANLKGQTEIATAEQSRQARVAQIAAEQEARSLMIATESENKSKIEKSEAQAKSQEVEVNQEAEAIVSQAKAEAEAIRLKAEAEAERANLLSKTPLGKQMALLDRWAGTVEKSSEGISKVVYCDPSVQFAAGGGNSLGMLGLKSLQQGASESNAAKVK